MPIEAGTVKDAASRHCSDHLANERTYLAWIRTSIGIMAFGFVVEKFALFIKKLSYVLAKSGLSKTAVPTHSSGYTAVAGIFLVGAGALMAVLGFTRFKQTGRQIDEENFTPSYGLDMLLAGAVLVVGALLAVYLLHSM